MTEKGWHRGARFWMAASPVLTLTFLLAFCTLTWRPEYLSQAFVMVTIIVSTIFGGSSVVKYQQTRNGK